jgi:hypothetical protein
MIFRFYIRSLQSQFFSHDPKLISYFSKIHQPLSPVAKIGYTDKLGEYVDFHFFEKEAKERKKRSKRKKEKRIPYMIQRLS